MASLGTNELTHPGLDLNADNITEAGAIGNILCRSIKTPTYILIGLQLDNFLCDLLDDNHDPWYCNSSDIVIIIVVADVFVPNRHQIISNPHAYSTVVITWCGPLHTTLYYTHHTKSVERVWDVSNPLVFLCVVWSCPSCNVAGIILCMRPANARWCYIVKSPLIGWVHSQNDPWCRDQWPGLYKMETI